MVKVFILNVFRSDEILNKKDIAHFRRQFKLNNDLLTVNEIFTVYVMKESSDIYHQESATFDLLEEEQKELFMNNFKKVLSGQLDEKLFELKFKQDIENSSQHILHQGLIQEDTEDWKEEMLQLVDKMFQEKQYEMDIVVTFIRGKYLRPGNNDFAEREESERDAVYAHPFIMCSMNKTQTPKSELLFDYIEKEFKYNVVVDPVINLKAPISGFLFPCFTDNASDVNHVLYSAEKKFKLDYHFIEEVLNTEETLTAEEDKIIFEEVVKKVAADQIDTSVLSNVYEEIHQVVEETEEDEVPTLDYKDVEQVLKNSGVENVTTEQVKEAFETVIDDQSYEFKASNVIPKHSSKSIKIKTKVADVSLRPQDLQYVRQVRVNGKLCLMIEVEENTVIEGFEMIPEVLFEKE